MYTSGAMSRRLPYLAELQPGLFCEVDKALAEKRGLENGKWATIVSPRGVIEAQVLVTDRMQMMKINGEEFHQIGLPFHYGESDSTAVAGDGANDLLGLTLEPNVFIQNSKIGACDIQPGRRPRGEARVEMLKEYQKRAHLNWIPAMIYSPWMIPSPITQKCSSPRMRTNPARTARKAKRVSK